MIRKSTDFYLFQEEEGITAAYFQTNRGTEYRVYFYPIPEYFEKLSIDTQRYHCGYFFGFTKLAPNEGKKEPLDFKVRNTILVVINRFFEEKGIDKVLVFYGSGLGAVLERFRPLGAEVKLQNKPDTRCEPLRN